MRILEQLNISPKDAKPLPADLAVPTEALRLESEFCEQCQRWHAGIFAFITSPDTGGRALACLWAKTDFPENSTNADVARWFEQMRLEQPWRRRASGS